MNVFKFTLSGKTAFFKKPDVNTYYYFTYGQIHKVALYGLFGAILGYKGYNQMKKTDVYPEFYEKLSGLNVAVVPNLPRGYIAKKIQAFNNSVGYASAEQGGNLIIKEQWLENPSWDIYVRMDCKEAEKLAEKIRNNHCIYIPYLGKNDHIASITDYQCYEEKEIDCRGGTINSLFIKEGVSFDLDNEEEDVENPFKYEEELPIALDSITNQYQLASFCFTNLLVEECSQKVYQVGEKNIVFF